MSKLIVTNIVSLDGYYEGAGGNVMALPFDLHFDTYCAERLRSATTLLLGRNSYVGFKGFWPDVADQPDATAEQREISRRNNAIAKVVVSDTLTEDDTDPWRDTTTIVRRAGAHEIVAGLKEQDAGDLLMFGSRTVWNDLFAAGLVDEIHLVVGAGTVGAGGTPAFGDLPPTSLRLVGARMWSDGSLVVLQYAPA